MSKAMDLQVPSAPAAPSKEEPSAPAAPSKEVPSAPAAPSKEVLGAPAAPSKEVPSAPVAISTEVPSAPEYDTQEEMRLEKERREQAGFGAIRFRVVVVGAAGPCTAAWLCASAAHF